MKSRRRSARRGGGSRWLRSTPAQAFRCAYLSAALTSVAAQQGKETIKNLVKNPVTKPGLERLAGPEAATLLSPVLAPAASGHNKFTPSGLPFPPSSRPAEQSAGAAARPALQKAGPGMKIALELSKSKVKFGVLCLHETRNANMKMQK